jgi:hypothetical protein
VGFHKFWCIAANSASNKLANTHLPTDEEECDMNKKAMLLAGVFTLALVLPVFAQDVFVEISSGSGDQEEVMFSRVCKIKEDGTLDWGNKVKIGKGKSHCAYLDGKIAVLVHRGAGKETEDALFYHVGTVDLTTMTVNWGPEVQYGSGAQPSVSFKGNQIVQAHRSPNNDRLWIMTGTIDVARQQITFGAPVKYDEAGRSPSISLGSSK